jgi:hypothetical protein
MELTSVYTMYVMYSISSCVLVASLFRITLVLLVWILGLRPTAGQGGGLKVGKSSSETSAVITTAVMADLPVLAKVTVRVHTVPYILLLIKNI